MSQASEVIQLPDAARSLDGHWGIRQGAGDELPASLVPTLLSISKATRALMGLLLADIGLNAGQDQLLAALDADRPVSVCRVAATLNVRPSTTSKMVERLMRKGFIERCNVDGDARLTLLRLTLAGAAKRVEVLDLWARFATNLTSKLDEPDDQDMADALQIVDAALRRRLSRLR